MEATAPVDERRVDSCFRVDLWRSYQEVDCHWSCADCERASVDGVVAPGIERWYGRKDDCHGYGMKNRNYDGGLTWAEKAVEGEQIERVRQRRKSV